MKIYEIGTGYTSIPARMGAATEIVVEELTKAFMAQNKDVSLLDIRDANRLPNNLPIIEIAMPKRFTDTDVQLGVMHKLKRVVYSLSLARKLHQIIRNSKEEVLLHFHNQYNLYFFLKLTSKAMRKKVKIAYTVHSYIWPGEWDEIKDTIKKRYFQEVYCVQNADYVLVLNSKTEEHFVKHLHVDRSKIYKVANGVNTDTYHVLNEKEIDEFKASIGFENKQIIFQVGSVCDRKNQYGAIKMLCEYLKQHRDTVYMYAGGVIDETYKSEIDSFAESKGISDQVIYAGELCPGEQLNKYYNAASVTVFPSKIESFGLVIIESLSAGTPVVLSEKPLFDLENGYSIFADEQEFVDAVKMNIFKNNKGEQNRDEIVKKYSWMSVAKDHIAIVEGVSGGGINLTHTYFVHYDAFQIGRAA